MKEYIYVITAVIAEIFGTMSIKYSQGMEKLFPTVCGIACYILCAWALSRSLLSLNMGVVYATWSAVGIIITTVFGLIVWGERLTPVGVIALILIIIGVALLNIWGTPGKV